MKAVNFFLDRIATEKPTSRKIAEKPIIILTNANKPKSVAVKNFVSITIFKIPEIEITKFPTKTQLISFTALVLRLIIVIII